MTYLIEPAPDAPKGSVEHLDFYEPASFPFGSAVLCRLNAPLMRFAIGALRRNLSCKYLGKDLGDTLAKLIEKLKPLDLADLKEKSSKHFALAVRRARTPAQRASVSDRACTLHVLLDASTSLTHLFSTIKRLFATDGAPHLVLSTIHKAKGLEWENVFFLDRGLCPLPWALAPWEKQQEKNLVYVAITRAKTNLKYIKSNTWK